jgi:NAD dependent epimerase/dehydratase family enzyme
MAVGEMADAMLLGGQRVLPEHATSQGFRFQYPELDEALRAIVA